MPVIAARARPRTSAGALSERMFWFLAIVVAVQGGHVVEHVIQIVQVYVLGVPEDEALGALGYLLQLNGTEEWLHLGFNSLYLTSLYVLILPLWRITPAGLPMRLFATFLACSVWVETWHMVEHGVIISHVIANGGCPCPGIGDAALNLSDTILHFFYNAVAYVGVVAVFLHLLRRRGHLLNRHA
jgi:hypothetical protein